MHAPAPVQVNCVVLRGVNDGEIGDFVALTRAAPLTVRFIELMPFAGNAWSAARFMSLAEQLAAARVAHPSLTWLPGGGGDANAPDAGHTYGVPGWAGRVGFIASMSDAFCGTCNRLRLTADGNVRACLHGDEEHALRDALRAGDVAAVAAAVSAAVAGKHAALGGKADMHALARTAAASSGGGGGGCEARTPPTAAQVLHRQRPMITIGG